MTDHELAGFRLISVFIAAVLLGTASLLIFGDPAAKIIFGFLGICGVIAIAGAMFLLIVVPWLPKSMRDWWYK